MAEDEEPEGNDNQDAGIGLETLGFILQLQANSSAESAHITNELLDKYMADAKFQKAKVELIQAGVDELLSGPWMPTTGALVRALYPSNEQVEAFMANENGRM